MSKKEYQIGCLCGRFQVHELHDAHKYIIDQVVDKHKKVILFLGVSYVTGTKRNPLDFDTRKKMIQEIYPNIIIVPLPDMKSDLDWSIEMDKRIREIYPYGNVLLYGGRDSFIPYYYGEFNTKELEQYTFISGTEVRKKLSEDIKNSSDFRSGVIYNSYNQEDRILTHLQIIVNNTSIDKKLFIKQDKFDELSDKIKGFFNYNDNNLEDSCNRILSEKIGLKQKDNLEFKYLKSEEYIDWRYKNSAKIISIIFEVNINQVELEPSNDIYELIWK